MKTLYYVIDRRDDMGTKSVTVYEIEGNEPNALFDLDLLMTDVSENEIMDEISKTENPQNITLVQL